MPDRWTYHYLRGPVPWLTGTQYIGGKPGLTEYQKWRRVRDDSGWKSRLSKNPRAAAAQRLWRYRNLRYYVNPSTQRAADRFRRLADAASAEARRRRIIQRGVDDTFYELMGTPKSQTFESPYIKPKNYRP